MFQEKRLALLYAVSPVHMGSGTSLGVIDNPIQREKHTGHPVFAGSGLKGAVRELARINNMDKETMDKVFGPDSNASDHAGAVSFSDVQLVAFPVRSLREGFVYVTSPIALNRFIRLASAAGVEKFEDSDEGKNLPILQDDKAVVLDNNLLSEGKLVLESYEYAVKEEADGLLKKVADWLADSTMPDGSGFSFFKEKLKKHLVLLSDTQFSYFVNNSTVVEPHVRIDDASGTADDGGLFFTENVPPEAIFACLVMASQERKKKGENEKGMTASKIMQKLSEILDDKLLQIGGDATTGRGQVYVSLPGKSNKEE